MAYKVRTDSFEGPFDLLLYLVSRQRVDIGAISVSVIVDQYLSEVAKMRELDLDVASDFLLVASTLLEIKAQSLVPRAGDAEEVDIEEMSPQEARDVLLCRLLTYKQFKTASAALGRRYERHQARLPRTFGPDSDLRQVMPDFLRDVSLDGLAFLAAGAYARRDFFLLESEHIASKPLPVEVRVRALHRRISRQKTVRFSELMADSPSRSEVVVTFLAVLELFKRALVDIDQSEQFGDIVVTHREGSGDLSFAQESDRLASFEED